VTIFRDNTMIQSQSPQHSVHIDDIVLHLNDLLSVNQFKDYCPNGLQVAGKAAVRHIVSGVTASQALLGAACAQNADLILVHHGYFWRNENPCIVGVKRNRLAFLLEHELNLLAYHLPLDAHPALGNNAQLGRILGFKSIQFAGEQNLIAYAELSRAISLAEFANHVDAQLKRSPVVLGDQQKMIKKVAWCTGAAQGYMEQAIALGADVFISGEVSEHNTHLACETGVAYISAGHHATERYGVQALGAHLAKRFEIKHTFIEIENPV
jgi:dinuclear metal center YbgI/SA1388 family protein